MNNWPERLTQVVVRFPGAKLRYSATRDLFKITAPDGRRSVVTGATIQARSIDAVCQQTAEWLRGGEVGQ